MTLITTKEKLQFWRNWTLVNSFVLILSYIISGLIIIFIAETIFSLSMEEWGSPSEQIILGITAGAIIGICVGITQKLMLRKIFNVSSSWIYSVAIGFILAELIVGIILWKYNINRGELSFIENNPLPHALILAVTGLLTGLIQLPLLRKHYSRLVFWIVASTLAWGVSILITAINPENDIVLIVTFILGTLLYGAITGATLMWVLKPKEL